MPSNKTALIAPGAFKHSLSAGEAAALIEEGMSRSTFPYPLRRMPVADGGGGTLEALLSSGGTRVLCRAQDPLGHEIEAAFGLLDAGHTAVVEMALASGLELTPQPDAMRASTFGTGQMIRAALDAGARRILVGAGNSATTDGGAGCLVALGARLLKANGQPIAPGGAGLAELEQIDLSGLDARLWDSEIVVAADVDTPVIGPDGSAAVFGPQKGATPEQVALLDANLTRLFTLMIQAAGVDTRAAAGGGAAGGLAAGLMAACRASVAPGAELIMDACGFNDALQDAAVVITGEGALDAQSLRGKAVIAVARRAKLYRVPTFALVGRVDLEPRLSREEGLTAAFSIVPRPMSLPDALAHAADNLRLASERLGDMLAAIL